MNRRTLLGCTCALALTVPWAALAQQAPLRVLVGFPAGGSTDAIARHLAQGLSEQLQRSVVVENRPGAGGQLAANALKVAAPDGNTLFLSNSHALAMIPLTVRQPGYDPAKDFASVGMVAISNDVLAVNPALVGEVRDLKGLVQWGNANPGKLNVGVPAPASDPDFGVRILAREFKGDLTSVPYRGDGPVIQDLVAGQIPAGIGSIGAMMQYAKSGKVRVIAMSGPSRLSGMPEVPTYVEQGLKGYGVSGFVALMAPAGTPADIIQRYNQAAAKVVASAAFQTKVSELGVVPTTSTPEELAVRIRDTTTAFTSMVERSGYKLP
ncbi:MULTISPECIES: tripartite tricarboxylate transporter substrate-binding protein [Comamonadaceae]|uniref:Tripartite tricarboxylate transporter substrate-binding protein n=1 Tax=Hydrogenophaga atypica TaxID=249409 RepID=A0ABW2QTM1_9BURK|nr:tripartite tricarboxylate transporter substrate-binding protein [Ottowia thiooxydans]